MGNFNLNLVAFSLQKDTCERDYSCHDVTVIGEESDNPGPNDSTKHDYE